MTFNERYNVLLLRFKQRPDRKSTVARVHTTMLLTLAFPDQPFGTLEMVEQKQSSQNVP
jgi:hypothetical protein